MAPGFLLLYMLAAVGFASTPTASPSSAATEAEIEPPKALREAREALQRAQARARSYSGVKHARGWDEQQLLAWVTTLDRACPMDGEYSTDGVCPDGTRRWEIVKPLLEVLGEQGSQRSFPTLLRIGLTDWQAERALERILTRKMAADVATHPCAPPSPAEVTAMRERLAQDFAVLRVRDGQLIAELPTPSELEDLAYFLVAVGANGPEVGDAEEQPYSRTTRPTTLVAMLKAREADVEEAKRSGDPTRILEATTAYLAALGYPGPIDRFVTNSTPVGYSYVLRDLALAAELTGDLELAVRSYQRANPGGGFCGTTTWMRRRDQMLGIIRSEEARGRCRAVVAERLIDWEGEHVDPRSPHANESYGPARLAKAGFDVARLYRGALVTMHRDLDFTEVAFALAAAPEPLGAAAVGRLATQGREDWARRVLAIEGLADTAQREALPLLLQITREAASQQRAAAVLAIGKLAQNPVFDPCEPEPEWDRLIALEMSISSAWSRSIRSLGQSCKTSLRPAEVRSLVAALDVVSADPSVEVRAAVATALGEIGTQQVLPILQRLALDPEPLEDSQVCRGNVCEPWYPAREAAASALEHIREVHEKLEEMKSLE